MISGRRIIFKPAGSFSAISAWALAPSAWPACWDRSCCFPKVRTPRRNFLRSRLKRPPLPARAKHVVHIFAQGAPSHIDTFDPKPSLARYDGQPLPGLGGVAMPSPFKFEKKGQSGIEVSEVFPYIGEHVDDMAVIRSMWTDIPAHEMATVMMNTGSLRIAKPCLGSWVVYGLGTENQNMPGFVSLRPGGAPAARRLAKLAVGLSARHLPGHERQHPGPGRGCDDPEHQEPVHPAAGTAPATGFDSSAQRNPLPESAEGRPAGSAHRGVRDRLQDADRRFRCVQHQPGAGGHQADVRQNRAGPPDVDCAPAHRTRRAGRPGLGRRLGPSQRHRGQTAQERAGN